LGAASSMISEAMCEEAYQFQLATAPRHLDRNVDRPVISCGPTDQKVTTRNENQKRNITAKSSQ
jgi:hypothetical protein